MNTLGFILEVLAVIIAAISFGSWQNSQDAGMFVFMLLCLWRMTQ